MSRDTPTVYLSSRFLLDTSSGGKRYSMSEKIKIAFPYEINK